MGKSGRVCLFLLGFVLFSTLVLGVNEDIIGKENHLKLLAVQENGEEYKGSIADLYLELKEGSGRVFLETFPLTKMDTQISTRFAKEVACNYFNLDCNDYDFIYTIKARSNIVGGPSAGAAIAALTAITLLDLEYNEKITITGTINSGGIAGPVGGVKEKLEAAADNGLEKILVVKGGDMDYNETVDIVSFARENLSLDVVEVVDLNEIVFYFTGKKLKDENVSVEISPDYQKTMGELADLLCNRTEELGKELGDLEIDKSRLSEIEGKKNDSKTSIEKDDFYSAASFCFGANILIKELVYDEENKSSGWMMSQINELRKRVDSLEGVLGKEEIETISDLQTKMVVEERLNEVKEWIDKFGESEDKQYSLAYAEERFFSALSWMYFFKMGGKSFVLDEERLRESCMRKISESEERYQYLTLIFGGISVDSIKEKIDSATQRLDVDDYNLCLMKAIQAKAEANAILSSMGLVEEDFMDFLESKADAAKKVIAENGREGVFPILGYSYYQYANSLKETDKHTAFLYLEYALEMSDLDIYFKEEVKKETLMEMFDSREWRLLGEGFILGILSVLFVMLGIKLIRRK